MGQIFLDRIRSKIDSFVYATKRFSDTAKRFFANKCPKRDENPDNNESMLTSSVRFSEAVSEQEQQTASALTRLKRFISKPFENKHVQEDSPSAGQQDENDLLLGDKYLHVSQHTPTTISKHPVKRLYSDKNLEIKEYQTIDKRYLSLIHDPSVDGQQVCYQAMYDNELKSADGKCYTHYGVHSGDDRYALHELQNISLGIPLYKYIGGANTHEYALKEVIKRHDMLVHDVSRLKSLNNIQIKQQQLWSNIKIASVAIGGLLYAIFKSGGIKVSESLLSDVTKLQSDVVKLQDTPNRTVDVESSIDVKALKADITAELLAQKDLVNTQETTTNDTSISTIALLAAAGIMSGVGSNILTQMIKKPTEHSWLLNIAKTAAIASTIFATAEAIKPFIIDMFATITAYVNSNNEDINELQHNDDAVQTNV